MTDIHHLARTSAGRVLIDRQYYTPDYLKLKEKRRHFVFLHEKEYERFQTACKEGERYGDDTITFLGKGVSWDDKFVMKQDTLNDVVRVFRTETFSEKKPFTGRVFALTAKQIQMIDVIQGTKTFVRREKVSVVCKQQRMTGVHNQKNPVKIMWAYVSGDDQHKSWKVWPNIIGTSYYGDLVYEDN